MPEKSYLFVDAAFFIVFRYRSRPLELVRRGRRIVSVPSMFVWTLQWLFVGASSLYLCYCGVQAHSRNARSWDVIVAGFQILDPVNLNGLGSSRRHELKAAYRMAGTALEMADYAERNGVAEAGLIEALRSDAVQVRLAAIKLYFFGATAE